MQSRAKIDLADFIKSFENLYEKSSWLVCSYFEWKIILSQLRLQQNWKSSHLCSTFDVFEVEITFVFTFWHLVSPHADTSFTIVSQSRWTLITASFPIPAVPENIAFIFISKDTVQARTVCGWNSWLCYSSEKTKFEQANEKKIEKI